MAKPSVKVVCDAYGKLRQLFSAQEDKETGVKLYIRTGEYHGFSDGSKNIGHDTAPVPENKIKHQHISIHPSHGSPGITIKKTVKTESSIVENYARVQPFGPSSAFPIFLYRSPDPSKPEFEPSIKTKDPIVHLGALPVAKIGSIEIPVYTAIYCILVSGVNFDRRELLFPPMVFHELPFSLFKIHVGICAIDFPKIAFGSTGISATVSPLRDGVEVSHTQKIPASPTSPLEISMWLKRGVHDLKIRTMEMWHLRNKNRDMRGMELLYSRPPEKIQLVPFIWPAISP